MAGRARAHQGGGRAVPRAARVSGAPGRDLQQARTAQGRSCHLGTLHGPRAAAGRRVSQRGLRLSPPRQGRQGAETRSSDASRPTRRTPSSPSSSASATSGSRSSIRRRSTTSAPSAWPPTHYDSEVGLARLQLHRNQLPDALKRAVAVLTHVPTHVDALLVAGLAEQRAGHRREARTASREGRVAVGGLLRRAPGARRARLQRIALSRQPASASRSPAGSTPSALKKCGRGSSARPA